MSECCPHCGKPLVEKRPEWPGHAVERWNRVADDIGLPKVTKVSSYLAKLRALFRDERDLDVLERAFRIFAKQEFVRDRKYGLGNFIPNRLKYLDRAREGEGGAAGSPSSYRDEVDALGGSPGVAAINEVRRRYGMEEIPF